MLPYTYSKLSTSRALTYSYVHITPKTEKGEYILFLHGFPSGSHDWRFQIEYFSQRGYGIVVPDLLGYGGTSKPLDTSLYNVKGMVDDVYEILKHEKIDSVIGVAHDWGSFLLSRMVNYHSSIFTKLVFIDIGYSVPGNNLTEQMVRFLNSMVMKNMGFSVFGYFLFFKEADAADLMNANGDSVQSLFHTRDEDIGKKYMGAEGGTRVWLTEGKVAPLPAYLTPEDQQYDREFFSIKNGGYGPPINWYIAQVDDINGKDDDSIPEKDRILHQPTLLVGGNNWITATADFPTRMKPNVPDLKVETLDAGHWIMLERADETNAILDKFFQ